MNLKSSSRWRDPINRYREPPMQDARPIQEALQAVIDVLGATPEHAIARIAAQWDDAVGADVAAHTRPGRLDGRHLIVYVDSSVWLNELKRFGQTRLLKNIRDRFGSGTVETLTLRLDPGD